MKVFWKKFKKVVIPTTLLFGFAGLSAVSCVNNQQKHDLPKTYEQSPLTAEAKLKETIKQKNKNDLTKSLDLSQQIVKNISTNYAELNINVKNINNLPNNSILFAKLINLKTKVVKDVSSKLNSNSIFTLSLNGLNPNTDYQLTNLKINNYSFNQNIKFKTLEENQLLSSISHYYDTKAINTKLVFNDPKHELNNKEVVIEYVSNDNSVISKKATISSNHNQTKIIFNFKVDQLISNRKWTLKKVVLKDLNHNQEIVKDFDLKLFNLSSIDVPASRTYVSEYSYNKSLQELIINIKSNDQPFNNQQTIVLTLDNDQVLEAKTVKQTNTLAMVKFDLSHLDQNKTYRIKKINFKNKPDYILNNINNDLNNTIYDSLKDDLSIIINNKEPLRYLQNIELNSYQQENNQLIFNAFLSNYQTDSKLLNVVLEFVDKDNNSIFSNPTLIRPTKLKEIIQAEFILKLSPNTKGNLKYSFKKAWVLNDYNNKTPFTSSSANELTNKEFRVITQPLNVALSYEQIEFFEPQNNSVFLNAPIIDYDQILANNYKVSIVLEDIEGNLKSYDNIDIVDWKNRKWIRVELANLNKNTTYYLNSVVIKDLDNNKSYIVYTKDSVIGTKIIRHQFKTLDLEENQKLEYNKAYETKALSNNHLINYNQFNTKVKDSSEYNKYHSYLIPNNDVYKYAYDMTLALRYNKIIRNQYSYKTQKTLGTGWILDFIHPKDNEQYPTTFFIATNIHVAAKFYYLDHEVYDTATVPKEQMITKREYNDGLYVGFNDYLESDPSKRTYDKTNLKRNLEEYKIKDFALLYTATNFLDKSYQSVYRKYATYNPSSAKLPDHVKDFAILKITFATQGEARYITRNFYEKYKDKPHKFAKQSLLTYSIDELLNRKDFYIFGYQGQKQLNDVFAQVPTINKQVSDNDFSFGAKLETNHVNNNLFLNKYDQMIPGVNNGTVTNQSLNFKEVTGYDRYYQYFNLMYSIADSSLKPGSSGSVVLNANKEIVGIHFAIVNETDTGLTEPLIFEGLRINDQQILPAYDLINGGMPYQLTSYKQALRKHFPNQKTWLFDKPPLRTNRTSKHQTPNIFPWWLNQLNLSNFW